MNFKLGQELEIQTNNFISEKQRTKKRLELLLRQEMRLREEQAHEYDKINKLKNSLNDLELELGHVRLDQAELANDNLEPHLELTREHLELQKAQIFSKKQNLEEELTREQTELTKLNSHLQISSIALQDPNPNLKSPHLHQKEKKNFELHKLPITLRDYSHYGAIDENELIEEEDSQDYHIESIGKIKTDPQPILFSPTYHSIIHQPEHHPENQEQDIDDLELQKLQQELEQLKFSRENIKENIITRIGALEKEMNSI